MVAANYKNMPNKSKSVDWEKLLRVWLFLLDRGNGFDDPITDKDIGKALGMKDGTVTNARNALRKDIQAITVKKKYAGPNHCIGSEITPSAFSKNDLTLTPDVWQTVWRSMACH